MNLRTKDSALYPLLQAGRRLRLLLRCERNGMKGGEFMKNLLTSQQDRLYSLLVL
jgi:hypothetical protein